MTRAGFLRLFNSLILRPLLADRLRTALTVSGVAIGIAAVVAIHLANASALRVFVGSIDLLAGRSTLQITGNGLPLDETLLRRLAWVRAHSKLSPVVEGEAVLPTRKGDEVLHVLGVDILQDAPLRDFQLLKGEAGEPGLTETEALRLLTDPTAIVLTERFAKRLQMAVGDSLSLLINDTARTFTIRALLADQGPARALEGNLALLDIAAAQLAFSRVGLLDRIDLKIPAHDVPKVQERLARELPAPLVVERPQRRSRRVETMLRAYRHNITALGYVALAVGLLLIYNTVAISVIRRRPEVGALRVLGVSRGQVLALFLAQGLAVSLAGTALGIPLGWFLADAAVQAVGTTVNALYLPGRVTEVVMTPGLALLALAIGVSVALAAALLPALEASRTPPAATLRAGAYETRRRTRLPVFGALGVVCLLLAMVAARQGPVHQVPLFGYLATVLTLAGFTALAPLAVLLLARVLRRPVQGRFRAPGRLALQAVTAAPGRTAVAVTALMVSFAMLASVTIMVGSFRETFSVWLNQMLRADLVVDPAGAAGRGMRATLSPDLIKRIQGIQGVDALDVFRGYRITYEGGPVTLGGTNLRIMGERAEVRFLEGGKARYVLAKTLDQDLVIISEAFSRRHRISPGDRLQLPAPKGILEVEVAGVYADYASDQGYIIMDRSTFLKHYQDPFANSVGVFLTPGADPETVRSAILEEAGKRHRIHVSTRARLRQGALGVFEQTFTITYALEAIALVVAVLGIINTLFALILERTREIGVLRFLGATRGQVQGMVVLEAGFMGLAGNTLGVVVGLLLSLLLIYVINVQSFGWTLQFHLPLGFLAKSFIAILAVTLLAGLYPARLAANIHAAQAVAEE